MSDLTLPADGTDRDLLFGVLALQLDFVSRADLESALQARGDDRGQPLGDFLVQRKALAARHRALLDDVIYEYLAQHGMDVARGLHAACSARDIPFDLATHASPAVRQSLATLPSLPALGTLAVPGASNGHGSGRHRSLADRRYRILRPHARGALGEVFVAHDEELNREVALKEIQPPYAHHPDSRARFVLEAEITGSLEHPGIVPVYSLGTYADGRPYYAMRFIKGESLHDAITRFHQADTPDRDPSERALSLRELLTRFVGVCHAVAYAHSRGVIHRDLKPSNVMLGPYGETLVVDWGLAKAFDQPMTADSIELPIHPASSASTQATILGQAVGTPAFMPPEQAAGRVDQMGPASDIYSLGASLYHLLTGTFAFAGSATEVLRQVKTGSFSPPRRVNRLVPAALDAIVVKAMAFRPDDRYATVHELALEIERWLADEKVLAHRESIVAQGQRWMRHHRPYVFAAGALLLATVVGLLGVVYAVNQERKNTAEERDNANHNLDLAKKAVDQCFQLAKESPLLQQERMQDVRKLLLEKALPFYKQFSILRPNNEGIFFDICLNHFRVGYITEAIGKKADAIDSYEKARTILAELLRRNEDNDDYRLDLGRITDNLGVLQRDTGKRQDALTSLRQARELRQALVDKHEDSPLHLSELALTCNNLGVLHRDRREPREALACFEEAMVILRRLTKERPDDDRCQADLAATLHNYGRLQAEADDPEEGRKAYEEARQIRERLAKKAPEATRPRADLASTLLNLGALLSPRPEEAAKARACFEEARSLCEAITKLRPEVAEYQWSLALANTGLGTELWQAKQYKQAAPLHAKAVEILEALVKQHEEESEYRATLAGACLNLGHTLREDGQVDAALRQYEKASTQIRELASRFPDLPETRDLLRKAHLGRAEARVKQGKHRESLPDFARALEQAKPGDEDHVMIRSLRAAALAKAGDHGQAILEAEDLQRAPGVKGDLLYNLACVASLAAESAHAAGQPKQAEAYAAKAVEMLMRAKLKKFFRDDGMIEYLKKDADLKFLQGRMDYTRFLEELEAGRKKPGS